MTLHCGHKFHAACITRLALLGVRADCPLCNQEIGYLPPNLQLPPRTVPQFEDAVRQEIEKLDGRAPRCAERSCARRETPTYCVICLRCTCSKCGTEVGGGTYCTSCLSRLRNGQRRASEDARPATITGPVYFEVLLPVNTVDGEELNPTVSRTTCPFRLGRRARRR